MINTKDKFSAPRIWPGLHRKLTYGYIYAQHFSSSKDGGRRLHIKHNLLWLHEVILQLLLCVYTPHCYGMPSLLWAACLEVAEAALPWEEEWLAFCATGANHPVVPMELHSRRVLGWNSTTSSKYWQLAVTGTGKSTHTAERQARVRTLPGLLLSC